MRVLVVEDDPIIAMAAEAILTTAGHVVIGPYHNADSAIAAAKATVLDMALVDINLAGGEEGVGLARTLLNDLGLHSLFATGQPSIARQNKDAAMGVLEKPYTDAALRDAMPVMEEILFGGSPPPPDLPAGLELFPA